MSDFTIDITRFVKQAELDVSQAIRKTVQDVSKAVILNTPVDTGRARGNWVVGVGDINSEQTGKLDKQGTQTVGNVANDIAKIDWAVADKVYITNTLPYILRLEYGSSKQAPNGMVRSTLAAFQSIISRSIK